MANHHQDQDERLNVLSTSIGRQNHLSIQIGSELDRHHELLEETDVAMDRTAARLNKAKRRLDKVAGEAKQYGGFTKSSRADDCREHYHHRRSDLRATHTHYCLQDVRRPAVPTKLHLYLVHIRIPTHRPDVHLEQGVQRRMTVSHCKFAPLYYTPCIHGTLHILYVTT